LIPWLTERKGNYFESLIFAPDLDPFKSFYASLLGSGRNQTDAEIALTPKEDTLIEVVRQLKPQTPESYWLILIDQFEELFTITEESKRNTFIKSLLALVKELSKSGDQSVKIVATMRADFLDKLDPYPDFTKITDKHRPMIAGMQPDELRLAIEQPAAQNGVVFEAGLVEQIIDNIQGQAGYLPLLQYTLNLLWEVEVSSHRVYDRTLSISSYRKLGGVRGALQQHIDQIYHNFSEEEKLTTQRIFLKLVDIGQDEKSGTEWKPVRRRANRSEFSGPTEQKVLAQLIDHNLLISQNSTLEIKEEGTLEIAHEALLTCWTTLNAWIKENRQSIAFRNRLSDDVAQWEKTKLDDDLLSGSRLEQALELKKDETFEKVLGGFTEPTKQFIDRSRSKRDSQRRRTIWGLSSVCIITLALATAAGWQWSQAETRKDIARSVQLATAAEASLETDSTRSLILALIATQIKPTLEAKRALGVAFQANHEQIYFNHGGDVVYGEYSPNNPDQVLTVSNDGTAKVWNTSDGHNSCVLRGHNRAINHGQFNPGNKAQVLTVSDDGSAIVWNIETCQVTLILKGHSAPIHFGKFDPKNPNRVVTASSDQTVMVWDIRKPNRPVQVLKGHTGAIWKADFDPKNSNRILTISSDGTARVWNLDWPNNPIILAGHRGQVVYGCFDPKNPNRVLTVSDDKTARVWNLNNIADPILLVGHDREVTMGAFSPGNPNQVMTISKDGTTRLWDLRNSNESTVLRSGVTQISYANFNPANPKELLIVGSNGSVGRAEVWNISNLTVSHSLIGHKKDIRYGSFSPKNHSQILTVGNDGTGRIWGLQPKSIFETSREQGLIVNAKFEQGYDDKIVFINKNGIIQRWDIAQKKPTETIKLPVGINSIVSADFNSQNANEVITVDLKGRVQLYDLKSLKKINIRLDNDKAISVEYSLADPTKVLVMTEKRAVTIHDTSKPNGKPLVIYTSPGRISFGQFNPKDPYEVMTASDDGEVKIWNLRSLGKAQIEKNTNNDLLWFAGYAPNNPEIIFAGGENKRLWVWNLKNNEPPFELDGHKGVINYGSASPKNPYQILTSGQDEFTYLWHLSYSNKPIAIREPGEEVIYSIFNPQNSNQILTLTKSGRVRIYLTEGKNFIDMAYSRLSRCLTDLEIKENQLTPQDVYKFSQSIDTSNFSRVNRKRKLHCADEGVNKDEKKITISSTFNGL